MPPKKDYAGQSRGFLTAVRPDPENSKKWIFRCECGNEKSIRPSNVFSNSEKSATISCGCLNARNIHKSKNVKDLTGQTFGLLTVVRMSRVKNNESYFDCRCTCGNVKEIRGASLTTGKTKSCGCLERKTQHDNTTDLQSRVFVAGTHTGNAKKKAPNKNNKSGFRGVWFDHQREVYVAYISFMGKRRTIGRYKNMEDAIEARLKAVEERDLILKELEDGIE